MKKFVSGLAAALIVMPRALAEAAETVEQAENSSLSGPIFIAAIVGLIVAVIVVSVLNGQMKTAAKQSGAANYIVQNSLDMDIKSDRFLYQSVQRRKIEKKN